MLSFLREGGKKGAFWKALFGKKRAKNPDLKHIVGDVKVRVFAKLFSKKLIE
jgi:hypothetical protein